MSLRRYSGRTTSRLSPRENGGSLRRLAIGSALFVGLLLAVPLMAHAGGMSVLTLVLNSASAIGGQAYQLQQSQSQQLAYNQQVVAPTSNIHQTTSFLNAIQQSYNSWMSRVHGMPVGSGTLSQSMALENTLYGNSQSAIHSQYVNVYGAQPQANSIHSTLANHVDMADTAANEALALAAQSDQFSGTLFNYSARLQQQAANTAPGTASMIQAQSEALELHSQAVQHRLLASLLRQHAIHLATEIGALKQASSNHATANQSTQQILTGGTN